MTRETKIGLLVGLAFIIVVGIFLSDYKASSSELPSAHLEQTATAGRVAVVTPGQANTPPITRVITPSNVTPQAPIPTQQELAQQQPAPPVQPEQPADDTQMADNDQPQTGGVDPGLLRAAEQGGEPLVNPNTHNTPAPQPQQTASIAKSYTIQSGDNLHRILVKQMGGDTKANRAALFKANPGLAANPDMVVLGSTLTIPSAGNAGNTKVAVLMKQAPVPAQPSQDHHDSATVRWYTVQSGDRLWTIAASQCGKGNLTTVNKIKSLNEDVLKGSDNLRVGMKLRLPQV